MRRITQELITPFSQTENKILKARIYDLPEGAAKHIIYDIIQTLTYDTKLWRPRFEEILDNAGTFTKSKERI